MCSLKYPASLFSFSTSFQSISYISYINLYRVIPSRSHFTIPHIYSNQSQFLYHVSCPPCTALCRAPPHHQQRADFICWETSDVKALFSLPITILAEVYSELQDSQCRLAVVAHGDGACGLMDSDEAAAWPVGMKPQRYMCWDSRVARDI